MSHSPKGARVWDKKKEECMILKDMTPNHEDHEDKKGQTSQKNAARTEAGIHLSPQDSIQVSAPET